jgi:hypothetical protein
MSIPSNSSTTPLEKCETLGHTLSSEIVTRRAGAINFFNPDINAQS